jgi:hypothetical protein
MDTIGLKLVSGEEIIARLISTDSHKYVVERPRSLVPRQIGNQFTIGLIPWIISAEETASFEIDKDKVVATFVPMGDVEKEFLQQTSGIQLVTG